MGKYKKIKFLKKCLKSLNLSQCIYLSSSFISIEIPYDMLFIVIEIKLYIIKNVIFIKHKIINILPVIIKKKVLFLLSKK